MRGGRVVPGAELGSDKAIYFRKECTEKLYSETTHEMVRDLHGRREEKKEN